MTWPGPWDWHSPAENKKCLISFRVLEKNRGVMNTSGVRAAPVWKKLIRRQYNG